MSERFEVGNAVYAYNRVSRVEKVYANGNFKIAGIDGQWRQGGTRAGDRGYHIARCEHYTDKVAARIARSNADSRFISASGEVDRNRQLIRKIGSIEEVETMTAALQEIAAKLKGTADV